MAVNLASKYSDKVVERFSQKSLTDNGLNKDYSWEGVKTVSVYSIPTVAMGDYSRTGANGRYGVAAELQNTIQNLTLSKDRGFTFIIDKGNKTETMGVMEAGKALARQTDEVVVPEIDTYRLNAWAIATNTQTTGAAAAVDKTNAYTLLLNAQEKLDEALVPADGRLCYCTPAYYNLLKLDPNFILASDVAMEKRITGQVGEVDGVKIIKIPSTRMPLKTPFILIHPSCSCSPLKLEDYKTHNNPPGVSGDLVEGRVIYDCFVLDSKGKAICKHMIP
ncbi:MAG: N4-gp56 family major capsid protein [Clostridium sp.]